VAVATAAEAATAAGVAAIELPAALFMLIQRNVPF
jgi:hypothetical protein